MRPELIPIALFVTVGAVAILRPLTKRLGLLLESMARENDRRAQRSVADPAGLRELLESMNSRLDRLEERQDFTDALLSGADQTTPRLPPSQEGKLPPRA